MVSGHTEMTCRELVELVTAWLDDALPAAERARFEAHLAECPYCRTYLAQMRQTAQLLGGLSETTIDPAARDALLVRFRDWRDE
jgi:anti-sigma factor RsiW